MDRFRFIGLAMRAVLIAIGVAAMIMIIALGLVEILDLRGDVDLLLWAVYLRYESEQDNWPIENLQTRVAVLEATSDEYEMWLTEVAVTTENRATKEVGATDTPVVPTSTPRPTYTTTPVPTSTPTPTTTSTTHPTNTSTTTPTSIHSPSLPPTHTPSPTAKASRYPAPMLVAPSDGRSVSGLFTLRWFWDGELGEDENFDVRVYAPGELPWGDTWERFTTWETDSKDHSCGQNYWQVVVVKGTDGVMEKEVSQVSEIYTIYIDCGGGGVPRAEWTDTPEPPPDWRTTPMN